jgi:sugar/nucleoside kinase (ribokinase family)
MSTLHSSFSPVIALRAADLLEATETRQQLGLVGFDGFIDTILQTVDTRQSATEYTRVPTLDAFGSRIKAAAGKSTNVEVVVQDIKLGGNGPIMANALAELGLPITYCGMTGYPQTHDVFREFGSRARLLPLADPAFTDAYEFEDGKLIVGKHATVADVSVENIIARVGESQWQIAWQESHFIAMVNWTMLPHLTALWKRIQTDFPGIAHDKARKTIFFDLADPEKRTHDDIAEALQTIADFQPAHDVILGLNEKEALSIANVLGITVDRSSAEERIAGLATEIRAHLKISICVIHPTTFAGAADANGAAVVQGPFTPKPKISTGAGDHFNAGFCKGILLGGDLETALQIGVGTSGFYVRNALSPSRNQLATFLRLLHEEQ